MISYKIQGGRMRNSSKLFLSLVVTVIIVVSGVIIFYKPSTKADTIDGKTPKKNTYDVGWVVKKSSLLNISDFVSRNTVYKKTISFETPNLKDITFRLRWTDDTAPFFGLCGLDTLTLTVTTPDATTITKSARCTRITKQGLIEITIPVKNNIPPSLRVESTSLIEAGQQLLDTSFDFTWVNEEFTLQVSDHIGEFRLLKRLRDTGNDFTLEITSQYYHATIINNENLKETSNTREGIFKETSYIPPSMCPFCDGEFHHEPWCPYYEDPFEDDFFEDDPWDDDHDYEPIPLDKPWQFILAYFMFLLMVFFSKMWVFGGIL
jgi:hypothetical protein